MEWLRDDGFLVTDDQTRIDIERTHRWITAQYWARGRTMEMMSQAIENSVALACFNPQGEQVGFARWATDRTVFGMLCDVFVDPDYRGRGLGKFIVGSAVNHPEVDGIKIRILVTNDAHSLYEQFGFKVLADPDLWMELRNPA
jgi:GNAT superfamily N-acetyltransferase